MLDIFRVKQSQVNAFWGRFGISPVYVGGGLKLRNISFARLDQWAISNEESGQRRVSSHLVDRFLNS